MENLGSSTRPVVESRVSHPENTLLPVKIAVSVNCLDSFGRSMVVMADLPEMDDREKNGP